jgi:hypothetical protein
VRPFTVSEGDFGTHFAEINLHFKSYGTNFLFGKFAAVIFPVAQLPGVRVCYIVESW